MKTISTLRRACLALLLFSTPILAQADTSLKLSGDQAKILYNYLTGSAVQNEGAAGHQYRMGKVVTCRYTDVDMSDVHGKSIPQEDPRRYACGMKMDREGFVSVNSNF